MTNRYILHIISNTVSGYYTGRKKVNIQGKIVPDVLNSKDAIGIKIYPMQSNVLSTIKEILGACPTNTTFEIYTTPEGNLTYRAKYISGKLESEQYYGR